MLLRVLRVFVVSAVLCNLVAVAANAIPAFAKAYRMSCASCHAYYPRLNDFGEQFRRNGYKLPGATSLVTVRSQKVLPVSAEVCWQNRSDSASGSLSSGRALAQNISFFASGLVGSTGSWDNPEIDRADILISGLGSKGLEMRAGRFVPAYCSFAQSNHLVLGYLTNSDTPGWNAEGVEFSNHNSSGSRYQLGWTRSIYGHSSGFYARWSKSAGGLGESQGRRFGISAYGGECSPYYSWYGSASQKIYELSADASFCFSRYDLSIACLQAWYPSNASFGREDYSQILVELDRPISSRWIAAFQALGYYVACDAPGGGSSLAAGAEYYPSEKISLSADYYFGESTRSGWYASRGFWIGAKAAY